MTAFQPAGIVRAGEWVLPGLRYPKHWYDRFIPSRTLQRLNRRRHPEVRAEWVARMTAIMKGERKA